MLDIAAVPSDSHYVLHLTGRVDGISAPDLEAEFNRLMMEGVRTIVVQCSHLSYISSAGLRIFLSAQKDLKKIGGECILAAVPLQVWDVFRVSGFAVIFRVVQSEDEITIGKRTPQQVDELTATHNGVSILYHKYPQSGGTLNVIGSPRKLESSGYGAYDIISIPAASILYGTGVAALGDSFDDVKYNLGETVILNGSFFSYPAVKRSAVDYLLASQQNPTQTYKFLHGFGFTGSFAAIAEFSREESFLDLSEIFSAAGSLVQSNIYAVVFLGESAGLYGMNLKKVPITEHAPAEGTIFDTHNFSEWIDYPIDAAYTYHSVAGAGIGVKDRAALTAPVAEIFSQDASFHAHAVIFDKAPLKRSLTDFTNELQRALSDFEAAKVQHLLGRSKFKSVIVGIIEVTTS